jgi:hypothetical protein
MVIAKKTGTWLVAAALMAMALAFDGPAVADGLSLKDQPVADTKRGVWFGGYDVVEGATYAFDGVILAFNRDLSKDGFALRAYGSRVDFDQDPGDGRGWQGDVMLGYMFHRGDLHGSVYVGADYQNYKLSPDDPTADVRGVEWGYKVAGDLATSRDGPIYFALSGSYSTAFDSYWSRVRYGFNRSRRTFGIEAQAFGNEEFDAQRLGAFLTFDVNLRPGTPIEITIAGGHQFVNDPTGGGATPTTGGGEGTYASIVFSTAF